MGYDMRYVIYSEWKMFNKSHVLIVDDDKQICDLVRDYLQQHGFKVSVAHDGRQMRRIMQDSVIDLVVLDVMLPQEDGLSLCKKLRKESQVLVVMLSAMGEETDRIVGLEVGADDYLPKPFSPRELLARIKALIRRRQDHEVGDSKSLARLSDITFLSWRLDRNRRALIAPDEITVPLSAGEYDLLLAFLENPRRTLTRDQLLDLYRGREGTPFDRTIDVQVARLRKKIEDDPKNPEIILTVRGGGYQFAADVDELQKDGL
jgi:two-component system OmpR family response regulator